MRQDVVLHGVGREVGQLPALVRLDVLRRILARGLGQAQAMLSPFAAITYPIGYDPVLQQANFDDLWTSFVQTFVVEDIAVNKQQRHLD